MYCSYHPNSAAQARCSCCTRALCHSCDHRVKGYPYCQDCIVLGIRSLSQNYYQAKPNSKAPIAGLLALIPGMGAVYNRQNLKAAVHFLSIVGSFQLSHMHIWSGLFGLAGVVLYLYSIIDAYRTAQSVAQGESAAVNEQRFKRSLVKAAPLAGILFIIFGILVIAQMVHPIGLFAVAKLLPVILILLGGYLLTRYFKRSGEENVDVDSAGRPDALGPDPFNRRQSASSMRLVGRR